MTNANPEPSSRGAELIADARFNWGFVPEQTQRLAHVVDALDGYGALVKKFEMTSLSPVEQQVVYIVTSRENRCGYCVAAHSMLARKEGLLEPDLQAVRAGTPTSIERLNALQVMTEAIVRNKGRIPEPAGAAFIAAGFRPDQVFELLTGIAAKMLVNFFNEIAGTPLDEAFTADAWTPPK